MTLVLPSGEILLSIQKELNENVNTRDQDLGHIKTWLRQEPHLPDTCEDAIVMTFLRGTSFSLEKCKKKIDMYYTMRNAAPEFFSKRNIQQPEVQNALSVIQFPPLPGLTPTGRRVCVIRGLKADKIIPDVVGIVKLAFMFGDVRLFEECHGVAGDIYIFDGSTVRATHLSLLTPSIIKKFFLCVEDTYPVKVKEVHVINVSQVADAILMFVKPFLKEKIRNRIFFHSQMESFHKYVPKHLLPSEYGGGAGTMEDINNAWIKKLESYTDWFSKQDSLKADESRRPGKPKTIDSLFGMEGSFRQLSID